MATKTKTKAPTLAQLKALPNPTPAQIAEIGVLENPLASNPAAGFGTLTPTGTGTSTGVAKPGQDVTKTDANTIINFKLPDQKVPGQSGPGGGPQYVAAATAGLTTDAQGNQQTTFSNYMQILADMGNDTAAIDQVQTLLKAGGYLSTKYTPGTLDAATKSAWRAVGLDAQGTPFTAMTLLYAGQNAPLLKQDYADVVTKINTAQANAASVTNSNVTLTDPNQVAQTFATAMEATGEGTPTPDQTQKFVTAFHDAEVSATQNEANAEKGNMLAGAGQLQTELTTLEKGGVNAYNKMNSGQGVLGPAMIATKAAPNLDAEALASAKSIDPSMYDATGSTDIYGLIQQMLNGQMQQPTTPASPTSQSTPGAILTTPLPGAP